MANWEDTVMSDVKMMELERGISRAEGDHKICEAQAKMSFKAGYDRALAQLADMTEECKQIGRREVVKWIELQHKWQGLNGETGKPFLKGWIVPISELKALKKEKGIK